MERREVVRASEAVSETRRERMRPQPCAEVRDALQLGAGRCAGVPVTTYLPYRTWPIDAAALGTEAGYTVGTTYRPKYCAVRRKR